MQDPKCYPLPYSWNGWVTGEKTWREYVSDAEYIECNADEDEDTES